ncbi:hypothetical protein [uncultured Mailhella sp.]|uniref:hypothetical protein n=1 Tax=uncultured Mailhella sp. TaxID=1981031 RepID=UPI0025EE2BD9|nr:hypothetical protein [uncultured Mailhella sp.]
MTHRSIRFDPQDYQLLTMINRTVTKSQKGLPSLMPQLSPSGIMELAVPVELRMASAVLRLLDTLSEGRADDRIEALAALRDEVLVMARTSLRINTGRVLVQLMKELVRAHGDFETQLRLAHDFRQAASGRHAVVRRLLHRYFMLEMPEDWNQAVFDNHVHDANTKGRKNATHLIMDAWLKGIRSLTVIYYNYVSPEAASELIRAARIMGITVRIGLLFHAPHMGRLVDLIWIPRGFTNDEDFIAFLSTPAMSTLMNEGRAATRWLEKRILHLLEDWNKNERPRLASMLHAVPAPLDPHDFLLFVGHGQASLLHLAEFIHKNLFALLEKRALDVRGALESPDTPNEQRAELLQELRTLDGFTTETVLARLNDPELFPRTATLQNACESSDCPDLLNQTPLHLLTRLCELKSGCRITLNLARLTAEDVLNLLWDCQGRITHLELFNLKDWQNGDMEHLQSINELQRAINEGSVPRLKQIIIGMLREAGAAPGISEEDSFSTPRGSATLHSADAPKSPRVRKLRIILQNIPVLCGYYQTAKLCATMGTDSTSRPGHRYGMGLAYPETLPLRARRELNDPRRSAHLLLPLRTELLEQVTYSSDAPGEEPSRLASFMRRLPGLRHFGKNRHTEWTPVSENTVVCNGGNCSIATADAGSTQGNIITLGGTDSGLSNGFMPAPHGRESLLEKSRYLNTGLANALRVIVGFIPAWLSFLFTQTGWLAWLGAPLWFLISGLRNILQAVLGSGGLHRSSVLHWKSYVSWSSLYVSLMYNGLSVVLLEPVLRCHILEQGMGISAVNAPVATYAALMACCGLYKVATHLMRGFSMKNILTDIGCTLISLPLALIIHGILLFLVTSAGGSPESLAAAAVFVVKLASDTVIGIVDGIVDRESNIRRRMADYRSRLHESLALYGKLEELFPEKNVMSLLERPDALPRTLNAIDPRLWLDMVINALDLMYFWFYQPRANYALDLFVRRFSRSERQVLLRMQQILMLEREVSQLLVDGLVGRNFAAPLSFYLARNEEYLRQMKAVCLPEEQHPRQ